MRKEQQKQIIDELSGKFSEPTAIKSEMTKIEMITSLNHYARNATPEQCKKWALEWVRKNAPSIKNLEKVDPLKFTTYGAIARMHTLGNNVPLDSMKKMIIRFKKLSNDINNKQEENSNPNVGRPKIPKKINKTLSEIDVAIDDIMMGKSVTDVEFDDKDNLNEVKEFCLRNLDDLEYVDEELDEHEREYHLKEKFINFFNMILEKITKLKQVKKQRAPRKKRIIPPSKIVMNTKFLPEYHNLRSVHPSNILGKKDMWIFDTKRQALSYVVSENGDGFDIKGTTVLNVDFDKSIFKRIRNGANIFANITNNLKFTEIKQIMRNSRTKESILKTSRLNENMIILMVR